MMKDWDPAGPTLASVLGQFVGGLAEAPDSDLRILDISGLPNEVAGPMTAALARLLFRYKVYQTKEERAKDPVLLVCEEANRYVPDRGEAEYAAAQGRSEEHKYELKSLMRTSYAVFCLKKKKSKKKNIQ